MIRIAVFVFAELRNVGLSTFWTSDRRRACFRNVLVTVRAAIGLMLVVSSAASAVYEVGPGRAYSSINAVPWESLQAGDTVRIHWRANAYKEKWVIARQGTAASPIVVQGVPGPNGELPVLEGNGATTRTTLNYWNENRGVIKIGGSSVPPDTTPRHIIVENLDIRSARPPYQYTSASGATGTYLNNASAIYIEKGQHIIVRNCRMHDCGNGFFVASGDSLASSNVLVQGNHIFENGNDGSIYEHNNYTAAIDITFEYNRFGPLRAGCLGNNLKDRSAGLIVRYNWIESGNRQLDLVDGEDSSLIRNHPSYRRTYVYGNVLVEPADAGNRQIVHYGGDSGTTNAYRHGLLQFYHNTLVSTRTDRTTLLRLSTDTERADCRNNILYVSAAGNTMSIVDGSGYVNLSHNWLKPGWVNTFGTLTGVITNDANITGTAPGFLDVARQNFFLATNSVCRDAGTSLHAGVIASSNLVLRHANGARRPNWNALDLGAYEFSPLEAWRYEHFGTNFAVASIAGNEADPNGNGIPNILEYAFLRDPRTAGGTVPMAERGTDFGIRFPRRLPPAEVTYVVQVSDNLTAWQDGSSFADDTVVLSNSLTRTVSPIAETNTVVRLNQGAPKRFLRVQVRP